MMQKTDGNLAALSPTKIHIAADIDIRICIMYMVYYKKKENTTVGVKDV